MQATYFTDEEKGETEEEEETPFETKEKKRTRLRVFFLPSFSHGEGGGIEDRTGKRGDRQDRQKSTPSPSPSSSHLTLLLLSHPRRRGKGKKRGESAKPNLKKKKGSLPLSSYRRRPGWQATTKGGGGGAVCKRSSGRWTNIRQMESFRKGASCPVSYKDVVESLLRHFLDVSFLLPPFFRRRRSDSCDDIDRIAPPSSLPSPSPTKMPPPQEEGSVPGAAEKTQERKGGGRNGQTFARRKSLRHHPISHSQFPLSPPPYVHTQKRRGRGRRTPPPLEAKKNFGAFAFAWENKDVVPPPPPAFAVSDKGGPPPMHPGKEDSALFHLLAQRRRPCVRTYTSTQQGGILFSPRAVNYGSSEGRRRGGFLYTTTSHYCTTSLGKRSEGGSPLSPRREGEEGQPNEGRTTERDNEGHTGGGNRRDGGEKIGKCLLIRTEK